MIPAEYRAENTTTVKKKVRATSGHVLVESLLIFLVALGPLTEANLRLCVRKSIARSAASVVMDGEEGDEVVFLSPDESPPKKQPDDQGASPTLRRSNRKRKSVTVPPAEMSKGSG